MTIEVSRPDPFGGFIARAYYRGRERSASGSSRNETVRNLRQMLKVLSVRGLLCHTGCNKGLQVYNDDPIRLGKAAEYLVKWADG